MDLIPEMMENVENQKVENNLLLYAGNTSHYYTFKELPWFHK